MQENVVNTNKVSNLGLKFCKELTRDSPEEINFMTYFVCYLDKDNQ